MILKSGRLAVELAPQAGGSVARLRCDGVDLLRPMTAEAIASGKGNNAALYPLVPYSNRIRDGRIVFGGKIFQLARNWPGIDHPMHGDGWAHAWQVVQGNATSAEIVYQHEPAGAAGGWPFRYRARQHYRLDEASLSIGIAIENLEDRPVPAGLGLHPFFVREADCELFFHSDDVWLSDDEVLPTRRIAVPDEWEFEHGRRPDDVALDNCFAGWDGRATIRWPKRRLQLVLEASEIFRHLVIYTPRGQPFFCAEPVSHANGAIGRTRLEAGAVLAGTVSFEVSHR